MVEDSLNIQPGPGPAPEQSDLSWSWRDVIATLVLVVICGAVLIIATRFVAQAFQLPVGETMISPVVYAAGTGIYLAAVLGVYLFAARRAGWAALGVRATGWVNFALVPVFFVIGLAALVLVNTLVSMLAGGFENPQVEALSGGRPMSAGELVAALLLVAGLVPFVEELFFRGMLYPLMQARLGPVFAIGLNALVFAAVHGVPLLIPGLFVLGIFLAYLRQRSGSIWPGVLFHAMQNSLALLLINAALAMG